MMNYALDLSLIAIRRADFMNLPILTTYAANIVNNLNATDLSPVIDENLAETKSNILIIGLVFICLIIILIIPLAIALRKRLPLHV